MGYTNNWLSKKDKTGFSENFLNEVKKIIELSEVSIKNGDGESDPVITKHKIVLNGDKKTDNDCETFSLVLNGKMGYCKTNNKLYDIVVKAILILAQEQEYDYIYQWCFSGNRKEAKYIGAKKLFKKLKETKTKNRGK